MRLGDLLAAAPDAARRARLAGAGPHVAEDAEITAVESDSRRVRPGALFCCVRGERHDGHDFVDEALAAGARAVVCERPLGVPVPEILVDDVRAAMGPLAAAVVGHPSRSLQVVGITGTNGKTTTVHLLGWVLGQGGLRTEVVGTLTGPRTTPEAPELHRLLAAHRDAGGQAVVMEVSSHALALHRVDGVAFAAVGFTNLSRDHLDFHASMEDYFKAKASLFSVHRAPVAVIDTDTPHGRLLADVTDVPTVVRTGSSNVQVLEVGPGSCRFVWRGHQVALPLGGRFNIANAALAAELAIALGLEPDRIAEALATAPPVPGRFERLDVPTDFSVVVDYAHTADGLEKVLAAAREVCPQGRVIVVFGCGGERDRAKRPAMAAVAERLADLVAVTSDNPRGERPEGIIAEVVAGFRHRPWMVDADRRRVIGAAVREAAPSDIVVIAGKGHERTQELSDRVEPFDDREVARRAVAEVTAR